MANEVESAMSKGNVQWECVKMLQVVTHGHKPVLVNTSVDGNGNTLSNHNDIAI